MYSSFSARAIGLALDATTTVDLAAAAGFSGVDLPVRDLVEAGTDPAAVRARMDDLGLRGGAWPLPVDWRGDARRFRDDLARLPRLAETAARLGLTRTGTWILPQVPEGEEPEAVVARHVERLGAIARVVEGFGSRLGLEVIGVRSARIGPGRPLFTRTGGEEVRRLVAALDEQTAAVGVLVDAFHLFAADEPARPTLDAWGPDRIVWAHVADLPAGAPDDRDAIRDRERGLPGENGAVDNAAFLRALANLGYDGPVTAEPLADAHALRGLTPPAACRRVAEALHAIWPASSPIDRATQRLSAAGSSDRRADRPPGRISSR